MRARRLYFAGTVSPIQTEVNCYKLLSCGSCDLFVHKAFAGIKEDVFVPAWAIKVAGGKQVPNVRMLVEPHTIFFDIKHKRFLKDKPENFTPETFVSLHLQVRLLCVSLTVGANLIPLTDPCAFQSGPVTLLRDHVPDMDPIKGAAASPVTAGVAALALGPAAARAAAKKQAVRTGCASATTESVVERKLRLAGEPKHLLR